MLFEPGQSDSILNFLKYSAFPALHSSDNMDKLLFFSEQPLGEESLSSLEGQRKARFREGR